MKKLNFLILFLLAGTVSFAQTWSLDKAHSNLGFSVSHLMVSEVDGSFKNFDAKITSSKEDFTDAVIDFTAEVASISTDNEQRDGHLKGADFFDAQKFEKITFKSKSIKKLDAKKYKVIGDLTMHGVTKQVELDVTFGGTAVHPYNKKTIAGFKVGGIIKRSDFGVGASTSSAVVGDEVTLNAKTEFAKD
ncbi:YceI family protein [Pseudochryseolinea flava]|uniref:Polyisoprenoid-binding protein n=1 Tax=Pseudochryseolinea flava TaxID=2059302 RepID=A0A364XWI0_9BACT|nr:YceI family protein [Pseudochryseolinea flava]RAV98562.1 polyisoprenoid-binding protein [Pseudochryseolinea flava]